MFDARLYEEKWSKAKIGDALLCQNISDKPCLFITEGSDFNNPDDYITINTKHQGGVGVIFPLDIGFAWMSKESLLGDMVRDIVDVLFEKGFQPSGDNNDVMIDDKKLFGTTSIKLDNGYYEGLFLSFNPDKEIIKRICNKEMKKEPIGLSSLEITSEEIIRLCQSLIQRYGMKEVE